VKIGIVPSLAYLQEIVLALKAFAKTSIVWDTVLKSSTEYDFLNIENQTVLVKILKNRFITPNYQNHTIISSETNAENIAKMLSAYCAILLKGGHHPEKLVSILYKRSSRFTQKSSLTEKHGSGCVLCLVYCF
jgi:hydroxymethylpyrimidine/phosphomethylpyrimidine kinase